MHKRDRSGLPTWVGSALVLIVAVAASGVIWVLVDQNRALKETLAASAEASRAPAGLEVGDILPNLELESIAGISFSALDDVRAYCQQHEIDWPICKASVPLVAELVAELEGKGVTFVSVMLDGRPGTTEQIAAYPAPLAPFAPVDDSSRQTMSAVSRVPTLVPSDATGTVVQSWTGQLDEGTVGEILAAAELVGAPRAVGATRTPDPSSSRLGR